MRPGIHPIEFTRGDSVRRLSFGYTAGGVAVDLTGCTARLTIRNAYTFAVHLAASTANGLLAIDGAAGTITPVWENSDTATVPAGVHNYDLELTYPNGEVDTLLSGTCQVFDDQTT